MLLKHIMVIFSLRHFALNCVIIWVWSNYPLYFLSIFKKWNLDRNIYIDTTYCQMLIYGKSSNYSRQIILWSASGKCHFAQRYEILAGSRNIKNINLAHISPTAKLSALGYFACGFIIFFLDERKELISNLCTWWRSPGTAACIARRPFQQNSNSRTQKARKGNTGLTTLSLYAGNSLNCKHSRCICHSSS